MRFALVGNHPHGLALARALIDTGRHQLAAYSGPPGGIDTLRRDGLVPRTVGDLEEVLADPAVEVVLVAGRVPDRAVQLRRALQSERHVLCAHPVDATPDVAYEAAMIRQDTGHVLLPLLPDALHPAVRRLQEMTPGPLGVLRLLEWQRWSAGPLLIDTDVGGHRPSLPGWDVLRALGGEVAEVSAFAAGELAADEPVLVSGRFVSAGLFRITLLPSVGEERWQLNVVGSEGGAELVFPQGWPGECRLTWRTTGGEERVETWPAWDPWTALVEVVETTLGYRPAVIGQEIAALSQAGNQSEAITATRPRPAVDGRQPNAESRKPTWQDAVRSLELDTEARRSAHYRRVSVMEYQEASEEVGFKGTMTLVGCGLIWVILLVLILSVWVPYLGWVIGPVLVVFLVLQLFRWIIPPKQTE